MINTVAALLKFDGATVEIGRRLRFVPQPPNVPTLAEFDRVLSIAPEWHRRWMAFAYASALRLGDLERQAPLHPESVEIIAEKTGKRHVIPIAEPVRRLLCGQSMRRPRRRLRRELYAICDRAGVRRIGPQQIRALSATEWERARPGAGAAILGHSLPGWSKATPYYLDLSQQLRLALPSFRVPPSLLTDAERSAAASAAIEVVTLYQTMPPAVQETAVNVLRAMVR